MARTGLSEGLGRESQGRSFGRGPLPAMGYLTKLYVGSTLLSAMYVCMARPNFWVP